MTIADTAADARVGEVASKSSGAGPADSGTDSMQEAQSAIESTDREADRKIEGARAGMAHAADVAHSVRKAQGRLSRVRTGITQRAREVNESSVDYIRQNPWSSVGISAGVGLLLGVIFRRR